jgi:hypothetical protein
MRKLVAISTVLGVDFPKYPLWKREADQAGATVEGTVGNASYPGEALLAAEVCVAQGAA